MVTLLKVLLDQTLALNERLAASIDNGFDWVFRRDALIQSGRTGFELVYQGDPFAVRYYDLAEENEIVLPDGDSLPVRRPHYPVPLVLVPPLGVTAETFDLMPNRSLARYMAARGFRTYLIDWGKPEQRHSRLALKDYADVMMAEALAKIRAHSGAESLSLMGWCMGGLLSLLHVGLGDDSKIQNIVTIASPIDLRGGGTVAGIGKALNTPAKLIRKYTQFRLHSLDPTLLHTPPWLTTIIFKLTDPISSVTTYWDLITRLWDREFVESHSTTSDYLNNMLLYPGGVLQDMLVEMAVDNKLAKGEIAFGGEVSRLGAISCAMLVFAGATDGLVPPDTAQRLLDLVSSKDKLFKVVPGGHMGVILGGKAPSRLWAPTADWLAERSLAPKTAAARKPAAKRRSAVVEPSRG